jgi:2-polyprenyl-3-methyl-5-hydroxy-6-metoxy-1,4-benzoquinol methylase
VAEGILSGACNRGGLAHFTEGVNARKIAFLDRNLVPGSCLDIGCGSGKYGAMMQAKCSTILQLDIVDRRAEEARRFPFVAMDANRMDLGSAKYDNIVAFDLLEHLDDDRLFLTRIRTVCNGRLLLSVPNAEDDQPRRMGLTHMHHTDKTHRREYSREGLSAILDATGFRVREMFGQYNDGLLNAVYALAAPGRVAGWAARIITLQIRFGMRLGLFQNRCIADWFCCAEIN